MDIRHALASQSIWLYASYSTVVHRKDTKYTKCDKKKKNVHNQVNLQRYKNTPRLGKQKYNSPPSWRSGQSSWVSSWQVNKNWELKSEKGFRVGPAVLTIWGVLVFWAAVVLLLSGQASWAWLDVLGCSRASGAPEVRETPRWTTSLWNWKMKKDCLFPQNSQHVIDVTLGSSFENTMMAEFIALLSDYDLPLVRSAA